jgi:hypothetical protein
VIDGDRPSAQLTLVKRRWNQPFAKRIYNRFGHGERRQRFDANDFKAR